MSFLCWSVLCVGDTPPPPFTLRNLHSLITSFHCKLISHVYNPYSKLHLEGSNHEKGKKKKLLSLHLMPADLQISIFHFVFILWNIRWARPWTLLPYHKVAETDGHFLSVIGTPGHSLFCAAQNNKLLACEIEKIIDEFSFFCCCCLGKLTAISWWGMSYRGSGREWESWDLDKGENTGDWCRFIQMNATA